MMFCTNTEVGLPVCHLHWGDINLCPIKPSIGWPDQGPACNPGICCHGILGTWELGKSCEAVLPSVFMLEQFTLSFAEMQ